MPATAIDGVRQSLRLDPLLAIDGYTPRALARAVRAAHKADRDRALEEAIDLFGAGLLPGSGPPGSTAHQETFQQLYRVAVDLLSLP